MLFNLKVGIKLCYTILSTPNYLFNVNKQFFGVVSVYYNYVSFNASSPYQKETFQLRR